MPEQSGERRLELSQEGEEVSLWSLIFEAWERRKREMEMEDD